MAYSYLKEATAEDTEGTFCMLFCCLGKLCSCFNAQEDLAVDANAVAVEPQVPANTPEKEGPMIWKTTAEAAGLIMVWLPAIYDGVLLLLD